MTRLNKGLWKSIFSGKIDLFDDLDQSLSQRSQTSRVSTPVSIFRLMPLRNRDGQALFAKRLQSTICEKFSLSRWRW